MSESSEYLRIRAERKARAAVTVEANAKEAAAAKAKAQGKATAERDKAFDKALSSKLAARAAGYKRSTILPAKLGEEVVDEQGTDTEQEA